MNRRTGRRKVVLAMVGIFAALGVAAAIVSSLQWLNKPFPGFFLYDNGVVAPNFLPHWTGQRQGLRFFDQILAIEGNPIAEPGLLYREVQRHPQGHVFQYTIERDGIVSQVPIASMRFFFQDWFLSFGIYLITGLGFLIIGAAPFCLRSTAGGALPLFLMVSTIFLWFIATFDFMTAHIFPKEMKLFAITFTSAAGIHLGLSLTRYLRGGQPRALLTLVYGLSAVLALFTSVTFYGPLELWRWGLRASYAYNCLAAVVFLVLLGAAFRGPISAIEKSRLRVVFAGAMVGFFLPTLGVVLTSSFRQEISYNLLLIPTLFFPISVAYALLKYSLFDIGAVLKVGLSRGLLTGVLLLAYIVLVFVLSFSTGFYEQDFLPPLLFSVLVVLIFNPLLRWIESAVDRYVYPKEYDARELQNEVSLLLRSLSRPRSVAERFLKAVARAIRTDAAHICFRAGEERVDVSLDAAHSGQKDMLSKFAACWTQIDGRERGGIVKDEVESASDFQGQRAELSRLFAELEAEVLIPIIFEENVRGFVSLGKKGTGRDYNPEDIRLLCSLTEQLALALENGVLYEGSEQAKENYRLLYDQSQCLNRKLVEADRLKKHFVANISHELRTPLSAVLGYTEVLADTAFTGDRCAIMERIMAHGVDLAQLMDSLLDFSRIEAGAKMTALQPVNVKEAFDLLAIMASRLIKERPIDFKIHIDSNLDVIESDPKKLHQILMQLVTNALKFTEKGEVRLEIRLAKEGVEPTVEILVSDTGIGIDDRDRDIIFDEFRQLDGSSTRRFGGTGVGLSLCRKLAASLGGQISVQSEIGKGSVFTLIFPLRQASAEVSSGLRTTAVQ